jgi:hypothetical protein
MVLWRFDLYSVLIMIPSIFPCCGVRSPALLLPLLLIPPFLSTLLEFSPSGTSSSAFDFIKAEGHVTCRDKSESSLYIPLPVAKERHRRRVFDLINLFLLVIYPISLTTSKTSRESTTPFHDVFEVEHQTTAAHGCLATAYQVRRYRTKTPVFEH